MLHVSHGNLLRAACVRNLRTHYVQTLPMAMATASIAMVSVATASTVSTATVSMATTLIASTAMAQSTMRFLSPVEIPTSSLSPTSSHSPCRSLRAMHVVASLQRLMLNECIDRACSSSCTVEGVSRPKLGLKDNAMMLNCLSTHCTISNQRCYKTMRESFVEGNNSEGAEGEQQRISKALDSSANVSVAKSQKLVVVVESPAKAKVIQKYLGADFIVLPSHGHVRDLAARAGSIRPDDDYAMVWEVPEAAQPHMDRIINACKGAKCLVLATDPDREGEAIAWHVSEVIKAEGLWKNRKGKVVRVAFNEVTKNAVLKAMQTPRDICLPLVNAFLARRALDYLISFSLSPLLWRKLPGSQSAGRVQSTALKLVCEREKAVEEFVQQEYWTVETSACCEGSTDETTLFPLQPVSLDGKKIELFSLSCHSAKLLAEKLKSTTVKVSAINKGLKRRNPPQPYITSTLQQDAEAKLGFRAGKTMALAQKLYEGVNLGKGELTGLITYMRTDEHQLSKEAVRDIRALVTQRFGYNYIPSNGREFNLKVKNTPEAHGAIRPTNVQRLPSAICNTLDKDALALYTLIWRRTVECQMEQAVYEEVAVDFVTEDEAVCLRTTGSHLTFPGFLAARKDRQASLDFEADYIPNHPEYQDLPGESWGKISALEKRDVVLIKKAEAQQHFTCPPARYTEGLLVKTMEELGFGRPSTYASTLRTLQARNYVEIEQQQIIPKVRGRMATTFLSHYFPRFTDYNFTALLEKQLDEVSGGRLQWKEVLREFWPGFHADVSSVIKIPIQEVVEVLHEVFFTQCFSRLGVKGRTCPRCGSGKLNLKVSRYGSGYFLGCDDHPVCRFKAQVISNEGAESLEEERILEHKFVPLNILLGLHPTRNLEVRVRTGPFGGYIQVGEDGKGKELFKLPHGVDPTKITMEKAIQLMKYPIKLGKHPEDGDAVIVGINKKSYFVRHGSLTAAVPKGVNVEGITLEKALELLKGKNVTKKGRKSLVRLAAEELERKQKEEMSIAKALEKLNVSGVSAGIKSKEARVKKDNGVTAEAGRKQSSGRRKTTKVAGEVRDPS